MFPGLRRSEYNTSLVGEVVGMTKDPISSAPMMCTDLELPFLAIVPFWTGAEID
jgi:hypothetical protein